MVIVFDMDGVLVDVTESYREAIQQTVEHFTGKRVTRERIQEYKNEGGWNNDWALSQRIAADLGVEVPYQTVIDRFQQLFLGPEGLILREKWVPAPGLLERLSRRHRLAIFTGRLREEMDLTLRRFAPGIMFQPTVCTRDIENGKPAPDGLLRVAEQCPGAELIYVGDTVDDSRSAKAAGVAFVGIASTGNPKRDELVALFQADGALAVVEDVNQLEAVIGR